MATPAERLATSLDVLADLQGSGRRVFRSRELSRTHRERLVRNGFLHEVLRGWLISSAPDTDPWDTTPWYASFWEFCAMYCSARFDNAWHLSPEQSLLLHAESCTVPQQVMVSAIGGSNNVVNLPFDTSLFDLRCESLPSADDVTEKDGLRLFRREAALVRAPASFLTRNPVEAQVVLSTVSEVDGLLRRLLDGGHSTVAGRLAGAFNSAGRTDVADEIVATMQSAGYDLRVVDPFIPGHALGTAGRQPLPVVARLATMWAAGRDRVLRVFPPAPGLPTDWRAYLRSVDELYRSDAYHSLSIEGYRVSPELVDRVRSGGWNPDHHSHDRDNRDAPAAHGYWQAFQRVRGDVAEVLGGADAASAVEGSHRTWYRELFSSCVAAGLLEPSALAGYRADAVFLRGSRHVPPRPEAVRDAMPALFDLISAEPEPSVRAVLGHWLLGYIHPYPDGNGRIARFLMNVLLASGGYPWTIVRVEHRAAYLHALEAASVDGDVGPFADFLAAQVRKASDPAV